MGRIVKIDGTPILLRKEEREMEKFRVAVIENDDAIAFEKELNGKLEALEGAGRFYEVDFRQYGFTYSAIVRFETEIERHNVDRRIEEVERSRMRCCHCGGFDANTYECIEKGCRVKYAGNICNLFYVKKGGM